jgi:hypothetical protein
MIITVMLELFYLKLDTTTQQVRATINPAQLQNDKVGKKYERMLQINKQKKKSKQCSNKINLYL